MGKIRPLAWALASALMAPASPAMAQSVAEIVGLDDLIARLGPDAPTGADVVVSQIEAPSGGSYGPDQGHAQFVNKVFVEMSGPAGTSNHATTVGKNQYGLTTSIAPDVPKIYLYEAGAWVTNGFLNTGSGAQQPFTPPGGVKLFNNSWVGALGSPSLDNDALRRADFVVGRDQVLITNGRNNDNGPAQPLMSHMFNGIICGRRDGQHAFSDTLTQYDGPGRMKPDLVAPGSATSWTTPVVNAAGSLMVETARTWPGLSSNPHAERADVIKAALMAGATHENIADGTWTNNPAVSGPSRGVTSRPIDDRVGAGTVNVNNSHFILTGGEQDGSATPPASPNINGAGWDLESVGLSQSRFYRFSLDEPADAISIVVTWNRRMSSDFVTWSLSEIDLALWRVNSSGNLVTLVGDDGLPYFGGGNVVSESLVDNIEHLYVTDLAAGDYVFEFARQEFPGFTSWDVAVAWLLPGASTIPEDVNGDGVVDVLDLLLVLAAWGDCPGCAEDINGDGVVNVLDLLMVLAAWN